jgi:hypothetical protein
MRSRLMFETIVGIRRFFILGIIHVLKTAQLLRIRLC